MTIETDRLKIIPLNINQLKSLLDGRNIADELMLVKKPAFDLDTARAMQELYLKAVLNTADYLWLTNWQIVLKAKNISIGSACFMDKPDKNKEVEIGYGIDEQYRNKGYMTEAVIAISDWALKNGAEIIKAETDKTNIASEKVLLKSGYELKSQNNNSNFWKKIK